MKRSVLILISLLLLLSFTACGNDAEEPKDPAQDETLSHTHKWEAATCTRGELCWSCGETRGEALGHTWTDATCQKLKTCSVCKAEEGSFLPHVSDGNATCTVCKQALNQVAKLDLLDMTSDRVVYDGVIVRLNLVGTEHPRSAGYLKNFEIYDPNGALVAQGGDWPEKVTKYLVNEPGNDQHRTFLESEFIPLPPGEYLIKYRAYGFFSDYVDKDGNRLYYVPKPIWDTTAEEKEKIRLSIPYYFHDNSPVEGSAPLIVR